MLCLGDCPKTVKSFMHIIELFGCINITYSYIGMS